MKVILYIDIEQYPEQLLREFGNTHGFNDVKLRDLRKRLIRNYGEGVIGKINDWIRLRESTKSEEYMRFLESR